MNDYKLYTRHRDTLVRIVKVLGGAVFNRFTAFAFSIGIGLLPLGLNLIALAFSAVFSAACVSAEISFNKRHDSYSEEKWTSLRALNNLMAYIILTIGITTLISNQFYDIPTDLTLPTAIIMLIYGGFYVVHAIGLHEYRYKNEQK